MEKHVSFFICSTDDRWKEKLEGHFNALILAGYDIRLHWRNADDFDPSPAGLKKLAGVLKRDSLAVLFLSPRFLESPLMSYEKNRNRLKKAQTGGLPITLVSSEQCGWKRYPWLKGLPLFPGEDGSLSDLSADEAEAHFPRLVESLFLALGFEQAVEDGILSLIRLSNVGPIKKLHFEPGQRLNVIAGDNGVGKTFLLECIWWALSGRWPGKPAVPRRKLNAKKVENISIQSQLISPDKVTGRLNTYQYRWKTLSWPESELGTGTRDTGLVVYARSDGSFALWDPVAAGIEPTPGSRDWNRPLLLSKDEVFNGLAAPKGKGKTICNGLISDWIYWQDHEDTSPFPVFKKILELLTPKNQKKLEPGKPTTKVPGDSRRIPTVLYPYGEVPVTHTASSVQRILPFAYVMLWMWESHRNACANTGQSTYRSMVLLFDELECHLHPRWQRSIISSLLEVKKYLDGELNIQFFITTHSPLLMASLEPHFDEKTDKALLLDIEDDYISIEEHPLLRLGPVGNWLTSELFGLAQPRSLEAEEAILKAMELQKQTTPGKDEVAKVHRLLLNTLGDVDPFWPRWLYFAEMNGVEV